MRHAHRSAVHAAALVVGYAGRPVMSGIDLALVPGALLVVMGSNGSGKSTLLKTLAGLLPPVAGEIAVLGEPPGHAPRQVAYLSQRPASSSTLPLRARDVVAMGRFARLGLLRRAGDEDHAACQDAIERLGLTPYVHRPLAELSGGQRQRVHLAQALARQADVLLLDEPTAGLDIASRELFAAAIATERARGATVVMATHDLADAAAADLVLLLSANQVIACAAPDEALTETNLRLSHGLTGPHEAGQSPGETSRQKAS